MSELDINLEDNSKNLNDRLNLKIEEYLNNKIYNIYDYEKIYEDYSEEWYDKFIFTRIREKHTEGYNPGLTEDSIIFLQNEKNFNNYFKEFLKLKMKTDYYVNIENKIVNNSREKTNDGSLGVPKIESNLRKQNYNYTLSLGRNCDNMYILIEEYLKLIENLDIKFSFEDFLKMKTY